MALVTNWQVCLQDKPTSPASLKSSVGIGEIVTALVWKANLRKKRHSVALLISEGDINVPS
jgi:hypothetical protein